MKAQTSAQHSIELRALAASHPPKEPSIATSAVERIENEGTQTERTVTQNVCGANLRADPPNEAIVTRQEARELGEVLDDLR